MYSWRKSGKGGGVGVDGGGRCCGEGVNVAAVIVAVVVVVVVLVLVVVHNIIVEPNTPPLLRNNSATMQQPKMANNEAKRQVRVSRFAVMVMIVFWTQAIVW